MDSRASDHMVSNFEKLINPVLERNSPRINLPTGGTSEISHIGDVKLHNRMFVCT